MAVETPQRRGGGRPKGFNSLFFICLGVFFETHKCIQKDMQYNTNTRALYATNCTAWQVNFLRDRLLQTGLSTLTRKSYLPDNCNPKLNSEIMNHHSFLSVLVYTHTHNKTHNKYSFFLAIYNLKHVWFCPFSLRLEHLNERCNLDNDN